MCFGSSRISSQGNWNWDGDHIIHDAVVPSARPPVGRSTGNYDIDPREFLVTDKNAVMQRTLNRDIAEYIKSLPGADWQLFCSRDVGSFDHRADVIASFVSEKIAYQFKVGNDPWQFPDETLSLKTGDCEDRALLIGSLLLASGISSFNVRVVLGKCMVWRGHRKTDRAHAWVMYKTEHGYWRLIEPALARRHSGSFPEAAPADKVDYIPQYLINDSHLWQVLGAEDTFNKPVELQKNWTSLNPKFIGDVHYSIIHEALDKIAPKWVVEAVNARFTSIPFVGRVDDIDKSTSTYDPRDHFDNEYITEGWQLVQQRLAQFKANNVANFDVFYRATHGIADFYAHSSFAHPGFGKRETGGALKLFDPQNIAGCLNAPAYTVATGFDLAGNQFSINSSLWNGTGASRAAAWRKKLISGRYAQRHDSHGPIEAVTYIHPPELETALGFPLKGSLPHHNEIAVDSELPSSDHKLYAGNTYHGQYVMRKAAAVKHIKKAFTDNWTH